MPDFPLGEPAPDFSDPIGLLEACHSRIAENCELLQRMCDHQDAHGADDELITAAHRVMRYFDLAAPLHHADEEQDLFPALAGGADLAPLITRLQAEHDEHEALWQGLRKELMIIVAGRRSTLLRQRVEPFTKAYLEHAEIENRQILPQARQILDSNTLARIGASMARRRQG